MARYKVADTLSAVTVAAGGGYDETFDLFSRPTTGLIMAAADATTNGERGIQMAAGFIKAWSLEDGNGQPLPVTVENVRGLPLDMLQPVLDHMTKAMSFLVVAGMSAQ